MVSFNTQSRGVAINTSLRGINRDELGVGVPTADWLMDHQSGGDRGARPCCTKTAYMDVSFILRKEVYMVLPVVVKNDFQKADDAVAPTHSRSFLLENPSWNGFKGYGASCRGSPKDIL